MPPVPKTQAGIAAWSNPNPCLWKNQIQTSALFPHRGKVLEGAHLGFVIIPVMTVVSEPSAHIIHSAYELGPSHIRELRLSKMDLGVRQSQSSMALRAPAVRLRVVAESFEADCWDLGYMFKTVEWRQRTKAPPTSVPSGSRWTLLELDSGRVPFTSPPREAPVSS
jgi:hypothetical protein